MALQENSLRNTGVFNSWFDGVNGIIVQVVVDDAFSQSEILVGILNNWFLEVCVEF